MPEFLMPDLLIKTLCSSPSRPAFHDNIVYMAHSTLNVQENVSHANIENNQITFRALLGCLILLQATSGGV